ARLACEEVGERRAVPALAAQVGVERRRRLWRSDRPLDPDRRRGQRLARIAHGLGGWRSLASLGLAVHVLVRDDPLLCVREREFSLADASVQRALQSIGLERERQELWPEIAWCCRVPAELQGNHVILFVGTPSPRNIVAG